jgi:hypothetical protein
LGAGLAHVYRVLPGETLISGQAREVDLVVDFQDYLRSGLRDIRIIGLVDPELDREEVLMQIERDRQCRWVEAPGDLVVAGAQFDV